MRYRDLQVGDVLLRDGKPIFVVLECNPSVNTFKWFSLLCTHMREVVSPDFELTWLWDELIFNSYDEILRDGQTLKK